MADGGGRRPSSAEHERVDDPGRAPRHLCGGRVVEIGESATVTYRVTFLPMNVTVTVESGRAPRGGGGRLGSLLDVALAGAVRLAHDCGGSCACTTCHVLVRGGWENLSQMREDEEDRLDLAFGLTARSRLACQAVVRGDVVVEIPS